METLTRRQFLRVSAVTAAATLAAACAQPTPVPTAPPATAAPAAPATAAPAAPATTAPAAPAPAAPAAAAQEAPALAEQVAAGTLPPLEERLPLEPLVLEPFHEVGTYGGEVNTLMTGTDFSFWDQTYTQEKPLRWKADGSTAVYNTAISSKYSEDGTSMVLTLRKGMRWSDGEPFTTEAIRFYYEDLVQNKDSGFPIESWMRSEGEPFTISVIDDYNIDFGFAKPYPLFHMQLTASPVWKRFFAPAHYLKQFHPKYNTAVTDFTKLTAVFPPTGHVFVNPDLPTIQAWKAVEYVPGQKLVCERNPYYWKTDPDGKQLPYTDRWVITSVQDAQTISLKIIGGEVDFLPRFIGFDDVTTLKKSEEAGNYKVILWQTGSGGNPMVLFNWDTLDMGMRELIRNRDFRLGLSYAIDRKTINDVVYFGLAQVSQGVTSTYSPWSLTTEEGKELYKQWSSLAVEYDVDKANELLDSAGLTQRGADGYRLRPDGQPLKVVIINRAGESRDTDVLEFVMEQWKAVGLDTMLNNMESAAYSEKFTNGGYDYAGWANYTGGFVPTNPGTLFPVGPAYWGQPLICKWFNSGGTDPAGEAPQPGDVMDRLITLYEEMIQQKTVDEMLGKVRAAVKIHVEEGPFMLAAVNGLPSLVVARPNMRNIRDMAYTGSWGTGAPGSTDPPMYYYKV